MMDRGQQIKYPYLVAVVGVALATITMVYEAVRTFLIMGMLRSRGFAGTRQFGNMNPFGLVNSLTLIAVAIAFVGLVWLGLVLKRSGKGAINETS
jgi:hypothetical protein